MPTSDTFEQIIRHQGVPDLVPFLVQLAKKDVVPVRERVLALDEELNELRELEPNTWGNSATPEQHFMLYLTGFKTYSRKEALSRRFGLWQLTAEYREAFWTVLENARPTWLTDWLLRRSELGFWQAHSYTQLRELEARQLIAYHPQLFALALPGLVPALGVELSQPGHVPKNALEAVTARIQQDNTLLHRDSWLLFEFDTVVSSVQGRVQLPMTTEFAEAHRSDTGRYPWEQWEQLHPSQQITWLDVLATLTKAGYLDRGEVLTRSLLALRRDFRRPLLAWFKNLFLSLKPTIAELLARQTELVELLSHPLPLVVNFALDQLKPLWTEADFQLKAPLLQAEGLMVRADIAATLKTLLTSLGKLLKSQQAHAPTVARLYAAALPHADAAVQERAARGLAALLQAKKTGLAAVEQQAATAAIQEAAELLAAPARALLAPWLVAPTAAEPAAAYKPHSAFIPDLSPATVVVPVADWPELLFLTGQVLKHDDPLALERWLDGLLRLRAQLPADYAKALQPYLVQLWPELKGKPEAERPALLQGLPLASGHAGLVQALLLSWALSFEAPLVEWVELRDTYNVADPLVRVAQQRLVFVETLLRAGQALPLLSTPTHAPHWVAPTALVQKLLAYEAAQQEPSATDLAIALARTAHVHPAEAAAARALLPQLQHPGLRTLLTWLLGPPMEPLPPVPTHRPSRRRQVVAQQLPGAPNAATLAEALPQLWAVAARTKQPAATYPALDGLAAAGLPGVVQPWQPSWHVVAQSKTYIDKWLPDQPEVTENWSELRVTTPLTADAVPAPLLYSLHATVPGEPGRFRLQNYVGHLAAAFPFLAALVPQYPAPLHWHALRLSAAWVPSELMSPVLHSLLAPSPHFDEAATLLLALGLAHEIASCQGLAVEVLLASVAQQRLVPAPLGRTLGQLLAGGFVAAQPLVTSLAQVRAVSPALDAVLSELLGALLPELPATPIRGLRRLLEAYADLVARTRQLVPAAAQARLREWRPVANLKKAVNALAA
jgi:hypothetical protein